MTQNDLDRQALAERSAQALNAGDAVAKALGMRLTRIEPDCCTLEMKVRQDMTNGHAICHGGIIFTLADTAFAYACNWLGEMTVAAGASIDFLSPAREGDVLCATARGRWAAGRYGIYEIEVTNQAGALVALFTGRSHRVGDKLAMPQGKP
ncbi:MAG: hydroxyphenylacetyl-CoA thioesterase PaaI [Pseudomonadota bacterium]